jgi:hypothetical protein
LSGLSKIARDDEGIASSLERFEYSANSGDSPEVVIDWLSGKFSTSLYLPIFPVLRVLSLSHFSFEESDIHWWKTAFKECYSLQEIALHHLSYEDCSAHSFLKVLLNNPKVENLTFENSIHHYDYGREPYLLSKLSNAKKIHISEDKFLSQFGPDLFSALAQSTSLKEVDLTKGSFLDTPQSMDGLCIFLQGCHTLKQLNLSSSGDWSRSGLSLKKLTALFSSNSISVEDLDLSGNRLGCLRGENLKFLEAVVSCKSIRSLSLKMNLITQSLCAHFVVETHIHCLNRRDVSHPSSINQMLFKPTSWVQSPTQYYTMNSVLLKGDGKATLFLIFIFHLIC